MIELSKYEQERCTDKYKQEIGKLYDELLSLMKSNRIICALGNQMEEMGSTQNRQKARDFLYRFTNAELFLPDQINSMQLDVGYDAYDNNHKNIMFRSKDIFESVDCCANMSIQVHVSTIYKQKTVERIKESKKLLADDLNELKNSNKISWIYEEQLNSELKADWNVFIYNLEHYCDSTKTYSIFLDELATIYKRVGVNRLNASYEEKLEAVRSHCEFLLSEYHHQLPYIWIKSVLFTHLIQRPNKIKSSDNLDITWASAYLPFVDYAVTDKTFCTLLKSSGLAEKYNTKVYDISTLSLLLSEIKE